LPPRAKGLPHAEVLRYQLLTAAAGTLAYAALEDASLAVLIVHEFITEKTQDDRHVQNAADYGRFLHRLGGKPVTENETCLLLGPFVPLDASPFGQRTLLIGKIVTNPPWRQLKVTPRHTQDLLRTIRIATPSADRFSLLAVLV
jgi:hypothetical protein